jgi:predicted aldo/keto reductase-like oxidoreductase
VNIPAVFGLYNDGRRFDNNFGQPKRAYMILGRTNETADRCVECGECEGKCPQKIEVIKELKMAHKHLGGWVE